MPSVTGAGAGGDAGCSVPPATADAAPRRDDVFVFFTVVVRFFEAPPLLLGFDLALLAPRLALQVALDAARAFEVAVDFLTVDLERARVLREVDRDEEARRRVLGAGRLAEADLARPVALLAAVLALTIEDLDLVDFLLADGAMMRLRRR